MSNEKEWLVSDKACKGCKYYGYLSSSRHHGDRCCNYTYITGNVRKNPPGACEVKALGRRARGNQSTTGCVVHRKKNLTKLDLHTPI